MSAQTISFDRVGMDRGLHLVLERVDAIDRILAEAPDVTDGGIASATLAFITSTAAEAAGLAADSSRALASITTDVLNDLSAVEQTAVEEMLALGRRLAS